MYKLKNNSNQLTTEDQIKDITDKLNSSLDIELFDRETLIKLLSRAKDSSFADTLINHHFKISQTELKKILEAKRPIEKKSINIEVVVKFIKENCVDFKIPFYEGKTFIETCFDQDNESLTNALFANDEFLKSQEKLSSEILGGSE